MQGSKLLLIGVLVSGVVACADTRVSNDGSSGGGGAGGAAADVGGAAGSSGQGTSSGGSGGQPQLMGGGSGGSSGMVALDGAVPIDDIDGGEPTALPRCEISAGDHAAASCPSGACPFVSDVVLGCDDWEFAAPGLRVAITPDGASLFTSSSDRALELTARDNEGEMLKLPTAFDRTALGLSQMQDGEILLASSAIGYADGVPVTGGPVIAHRTGDTWTAEWAPVPNAENARLFDFEIDESGTAHQWFESFSGGPDGFRHATRTSDGDWTLETIEPGHPGAYTRWTLDREGRSIGFSYQIEAQFSQLETRIDGADAPFGRESDQPLSPVYKPLSPAVPATTEDVPAFAAVVDRLDALNIVWPSSTSTSGYVEREVPNSARQQPQCFQPTAPSCSPDCVEQSEGMVAFAVSQTSDGLLWLVWSEIHEDIAYRYTPCDQPWECSCGVEVMHDNSTATLHVVSFDFATEEATERLTMPMPPLDTTNAFSTDGLDLRLLDVRAFGDQLAIGMRITSDVRFNPNWSSQAVRLLHLDTAALLAQ